MPGRRSTFTRRLSRSTTKARSSITAMPLGRSNWPGPAPRSPTWRTKAPVAPSYTTSRWVDLAVASTSTLPSGAAQLATESMLSSGVIGVAKASGTGAAFVSGAAREASRTRSARSSASSTGAAAGAPPSPQPASASARKVATRARGNGFCLVIVVSMRSSERGLDAERVAAPVQLVLQGGIARPLVELQRFVEQVGGFEVQAPARADPVVEAEVELGIGRHPQVVARIVADLVQVLAAVHRRQAGAEAVVLPADVRAVQALGRQRQREGFAGAILGAGDELGVQPGGAEPHQQPAPGAGQEVELLLPVELQAEHARVLAIDRPGHVVAREGRIAVGPGLDDVAVDRVVEDGGGDGPRGADVELERQVDVGRLVGIELRIAQLDFLVVAVDAGARRDVAEGRARDGAGDRAAQHPVAVGVVAQVQAGQHTGVGARRGAGAGGKLAVLVDLDPPAAGVEVGALHARAGDHAQVAEVHRRHQV